VFYAANAPEFQIKAKPGKNLRLFQNFSFERATSKKAVFARSSLDKKRR
jgi:hypothetical protein